MSGTPSRTPAFTPGVTPAITPAFTPAFTPATVHSTGATGPSQTQEQRYAALSQEAEAIKELKEMELLPMLLDLIENLKLGKITPKDFDNAAGRIRVRIAKSKQLVNQIEGLNETPEVGIEKMEGLQRRMNEKREVLEEFGREVKGLSSGH